MEYRTNPSADQITGGLFAALLLAFAASVFVTCCSVYKLGRMAAVNLSLAGGWLRRRAWWGALPALLLAAPLVAQEPEEAKLAPRTGPAAWCSTESCEKAGIAAALHQWECHWWPTGPTCSLDALAGRDSGGFGVFGELTEGPSDLGFLPMVPPETFGRLHLGLTVTAPYSELDEAEWSGGLGLKVTLEPQ